MGIFIKSEVNEAILIIVKYYERKKVNIENNRFDFFSGVLKSEVKMFEIF